MSDASSSARARVFLATHQKGMTRARKEAGEWRTERVLEGAAVQCLAVGRGALWAGTRERGVLRSDDDGASWRPAGLAGVVVKALAPSPHDGDTVYAGLRPAGVAVTTDGGGGWAELEGFQNIRGRRFWFSPADAEGVAYVQGLGVSPDDPDILVAGIEFGAVVRSTDGGRTWSGHRKGAIRDCHSLAFHHSDGSRVYEGGAGFRRPLAMSRDGGVTWSSPKGAKRWYGWACAADPEDPDVFYAGATSGPGRAHGSKPARATLYRSRAGGRWEALGGGLPDPLDAFPYALITDPGAPGHVYAGLDDGTVWFSADQGDRWERLPVELGTVHRTVVAVW